MRPELQPINVIGGAVVSTMMSRSGPKELSEH